MKALVSLGLAALVGVAISTYGTAASADLCMTDTVLGLELALGVNNSNNLSNGDTQVDLVISSGGFAGYGALVKDSSSGLWRLAAELKDISNTYNWYCRWDSITGLPATSASGSVCTDTYTSGSCTAGTCTLFNCTPVEGGAGADDVLQ